MSVIRHLGKRYTYVDYHDLSKKLKITNKEARGLIRDSKEQRKKKRSKTIQKYQKTDKYKEYTKSKYLDKIKDQYVNKTAYFIIEFQNRSGKKVKNETDILDMIYDAKSTKDVRKIYEDLITIIVT